MQRRLDDSEIVRASVPYQASKVFHPFKSKKEKKLEHVEKGARPIVVIVEEKERTWFWSLLLLFIGLFLQAIVVFDIS